MYSGVDGGEEPAATERGYARRGEGRNRGRAYMKSVGVGQGIATIVKREDV